MADKRALETIDIRLFKQRDWLGKPDATHWKADVFLDDGRDYHAIGGTPYEALTRLAHYWKGKDIEREQSNG